MVHSHRAAFQLPHPAHAVGSARFVGAVHRQRNLVPQAQPQGQRRVDASLRRIQVGVGADGRDALLNQGQHLPPGGGLIGDLPHLSPDHRVVGQDQLASLLRRLPNHLWGDVQSHQDSGDLLVPAAHQKARVVKVHLRAERRFPVQQVPHIFYCCHWLHSSLICRSSSSRFRSVSISPCGGVLPWAIPASARSRRRICSSK